TSTAMLPQGLSLISLGTSLARSGRSRTCPTLASTRYLLPRKRESVLALAGDSTMTRGFAIEAPLPYHWCPDGPVSSAGQPRDAAGHFVQRDPAQDGVHRKARRPGQHLGGHRLAPVERLQDRIRSGIA